MTNMSYCRFQNTLADLRDCDEHMNDDLEPEAKARAVLIKLCLKIAEDMGEEYKEES